MPCLHKFHAQNSINRPFLPNWDVDTLIIGTFNPNNDFVPNNPAEYFYGRSRYFWRALPRFANHGEIDRDNIESQIKFLKDNKIGLTDILISIDDADVNNLEHCQRIATFKDEGIEKFKEFTWNTDNIIQLIHQQRIKAVYFTKLGKPNQFNPDYNTFERQMRNIEGICHESNVNCYRLHSPTGQGLGAGQPRVNKLIQRWYYQNGGIHFPFISPNFDINLFPFM